MRLFIAIDFSDAVKKVLLDAIGELRKAADGGNFTRAENLHLTLAFIGESERASDIRSVLDGISAAPFEMTVGGFGRFGELYWAGIEKNESLRRLAADIQNGLRDEGFAIERREFKPHITLARQLKATEPVRLSLPRETMTVSRVSLKKTERINGRLVYTEIYGREL